MGHYQSETPGYERPNYQYDKYHKLGFTTGNFNSYGGSFVSCNFCFQMWKINGSSTPPPPSIIRHTEECLDRG